MIWFFRRSSRAEVVVEEMDGRLMAMLESIWEAFSRADMELEDNDSLLLKLDSILEDFLRAKMVPEVGDSLFLVLESISEVFWISL